MPPKGRRHLDQGEAKMKSIYLPIAVGLALTGCDMANKSDAPANGAATVSYTHLTLPTILRV